MKTVVVGIDGSEGSVGALEFAIEEARIRGAGVKAVEAWEIPASAYGGLYAPVAPNPADFEKIARDRLDQVIAEATPSTNGVSVTPVLRQGHPADVLVAEAREAELLVVGSRGLGGFKGLLLGSVSQQCAHHATCPVAIVPNGHA